MKNRIWIVVAITLMLMLLISACSNYINSSDDFYGGDVIDAEMLSSIAEYIFSAEEELRPEEPEDNSDENNSSEDGASDVTDETTAPNPEDLTDEKVTSEEPVTEDVTTEEATTEREHDGVYYWTESGTKYHKWSDCGHLKNSSNVISGTLEEAIAAKKDGLCASCAKK